MRYWCLACGKQQKAKAIPSPTDAADASLPVLPVLPAARHPAAARHIHAAARHVPAAAVHVPAAARPCSALEVPAVWHVSAYSWAASLS